VENCVIHAERCKACGYCVQFCPKKALGFSKGRVNQKGYNPVEHINDSCTASGKPCGICYLVCPDYVFEIIEAPAGMAMGA
jgi:2-oxoglutarate ferredoxin oxidoreductase subunit delta